MENLGLGTFSRVQLFISCRKLKDMDTFSKSDPCVEVLEHGADSRQWVQVGRTEVIWDNLNPDFVKNFIFDFHFEEQKYLQFKVYDIEDKAETLANADYIGQAECTLGEIIGAHGQQLVKTLHLPGKSEVRGNIILRTEEVAECKEKVVAQCVGVNLEDISGWFRSYKPFFHISRAMENGSFQRVYTSEHIKSKNPSWRQFEMSMQNLCNNDYNRPLLVEVYDHHSNGSHKFVASGQFTVADITERGNKNIVLRNEQKAKNKKYKGSGTFVFRSIDIVRVHSFIDYIAGGCQIALITAVDFTASNGNPQLPNSLHYLNPQGMNDYERCLSSVSEILLNYDSDKMVPMYGFGGKIGGQISHCFHMNFNPADPEVPGIEGVMASYRNSLQCVELSGPTLFAQVIQKAVAAAQEVPISQANQTYFILLIITDGEIHDMRDTIDWIVQGSRHPLSIVIVGLGNDSFTNMVKLDADDEPLIDSHGRRMERDIVQFVPYRDVGNSSTRLAREVLDEIPREIVNYFTSRNIVPNPPIQVDMNDLMAQYSARASQAMMGVPPAPPGNVYQRQGTGVMQPGVPMSMPPVAMGIPSAPPGPYGMPQQPPSQFANMIGQRLINQQMAAPSSYEYYQPPPSNN